MIPIFCNRRFNFLAGAELNRICAANECGGKNKTAKYAPRISKSIHHPTVPLLKQRATAGNDVTIHASLPALCSARVARFALDESVAELRLIGSACRQLTPHVD
jgi:hypothetical protein